jgi:hypothetical protein
MDKISYSKIAQVLEDTRTALLSVTSERDKLAGECTALKRHFEAEKLASEMHTKGLRLGDSHEELVADLEKAAEEGRLPVIQEAVNMAAPNMGLSSIHMTDDVAPGAGSNHFENFILGSVG